MFLGNKYHLSYCTNIHPGPDWKTTFESLKKYVPEVKKEVAFPGSFGLGLRLSNKASKELAEGENLKFFKQWLDDQDCYVYTMNGFPFGNFHGESVKDRVYMPDWTKPERYEYTERLFDQLAFLLPEGLEGGISTSPVSYKGWFEDEESKKEVNAVAAEQLARMAIYLKDKEESSGSYLHLDLEPEPDCFLENTKDVLDYYKEYLLPIGGKLIGEELNISQEEAEKIILRYICVCYDICHFSLAYEDPDYTLPAWREAGIRVGKIQISAALKILANGNTDIWPSLSKFNEPTYLHQVTEKIDNKVVTYADLPAILDTRPEFEELRAHFHVPVFLDAFDQLHSTQDHIIKVFEYLKQNKVSNHLEIETYTWEVLPQNLKVELTASIAREIDWVLKNI